MIVASAFPGDSMRIANIQHDVYSDALGVILRAAVAVYERAERVLGIKTELGELIQTIALDHRTVQWFHDAVAGQFRFEYCCNADLFEEVLDPNDPEQDIICRWMRFLYDELERLFDWNYYLPRQILIAVIYKNPDPRGMDAEEKIFDLTLREYSNLFPNLRTEHE